MDLESLKGIVVEQLQQRVGLDEKPAKGAADVVVELIQKHGPALLEGGLEDKLGDAGKALGGLFGKK